MKRGWWTRLSGLLAICTIVAAIWAATLLLTRFSGLGWPEMGQFGDMFGAVNALFSGLAFAGLIFTIVVQMNELENQRKELELQRQDSELSRREFNLQRFENTLFGLINMFNDHVNSFERSRISRHTEGVVQKIVRGRGVVKEVANDLPDEIFTPKQYVFTSGEPGPAAQRRTLQEQIAAYNKFFKAELEPDFGTYMRLLWGIFRHIDNSNLDDGQKNMYSRIVRAHLSSAEVKFILFDCSNGVGVDFRPWIQKYGLLKHLPEKDRAANPSLVALYDPSAFEPVPIPYTTV